MEIEIEVFSFVEILKLFFLIVGWDERYHLKTLQILPCYEFLQ